MKKARNIVITGMAVFSMLIGSLGFESKSVASTSWSTWTDTKPETESQYDIETRTVYRHRDKSTTTSSSSTLSGWTQYDLDTTWTDWSSWQDISVSSSSEKEVKTRKMYCYRDKSTTTSSSSTLSGWTQYDSITTWGDWSAWQDTAVTASSTREVETQQVQTAAGYTQYRYCRWRSDDCSKGTWWHFCDACGKASYGGTWYIQTTEWMNSPVTTLGTGNQCYHGYSYLNTDQKTYQYGGQNWYWQQTQYIQPTYKTQYRYKDSQTTYYFYKWGDWSEWSTTQPESITNREISNKTQYSYRDATTTYYFYKWGDWSEWSTTQPVSVSNREIEEKLQYRYKLKQNTGNESDSSNSPITEGSMVTVSKAIYTVTNTKKKTVTYTTNGNRKITSITIPSTVKIQGKKYKVTKIADNAFKNNKKIKKVKIGSNITSIGKNAFKGCTNLKTVTLGKNVKTIGNSAFEGCKKIESIAITKNVTTIGSKAFYKCKKLKTVTIATSKLKKVGNKAFGKIASRPNLQFKSSIPESKRKKFLKLLQR